MPQYDRKDHYHQKAKSQGFASRAVFKFEQLQQRFRLVRPGDRVIDLGCAPGGWLQILATLVGPQGRVLGIDLEPITIPVPSWVTTLQADMHEIAREPASIKDLLQGAVDLVVSDLAPHTSGVRFRDAARSAELATAAWACARVLLRPGGHFVVKIFESPDAIALRRTLAPAFARLEIVTPAATREGSKEKYLVAMNRQS